MPTEQQQGADAAEAETGEDMVLRHGKEIQEVIDDHAEQIKKLDPNLDAAAILETRKRCSRLIAEACRRHVAEARTHSVRTAPPPERHPHAEPHPDDRPVPGAEAKAALPAPEREHEHL